MEAENKSSQVTKALAEAEHALSNTDPEPFSPKAFEELKQTIAWFIGELEEQSINVSKRHRADNVAESHVKTAADYLIAYAPSRIFRLLGTFGGFLFGAALSNLLSLISTRAFTVSSVIGTVIFSTIGAFLMALHIARE